MSRAKTIAYYERFGSRAGYKLLLGGHRHFGWYKDRKFLRMSAAANAMVDHLAEFASIANGSRVLDAGCGQGRSSLRLAKKYGAKVSGVDIVPRSISIAKRLGKDCNLVDYQEADYNSLPFADSTFDVVFTLETFTHSSDPEATINEFLRVLRPGGRIAIFDYSIAPLDRVPGEIAQAIHTIAEKTDCPGFDTITHDYYAKLLPKLGITNYTVIDESRSVLPAIKRAYVLSWLPYHVLKLLRREDRHPNILIGHTAWIAWAKDYIRYITVRITKP